MSLLGVRVLFKTSMLVQKIPLNIDGWTLADGRAEDKLGIYKIIEREAVEGVIWTHGDKEWDWLLIPLYALVC